MSKERLEIEDDRAIDIESNLDYTIMELVKANKRLIAECKWLEGQIEGLDMLSDAGDKDFATMRDAKDATIAGLREQLAEAKLDNEEISLVSRAYKEQWEFSDELWHEAHEQLTAKDAIIAGYIDANRTLMNACEGYQAEMAGLRSAIEKCLHDNGHLADGDNCTLIDLKRAIAGQPVSPWISIKDRLPRCDKHGISNEVCITNGAGWWKAHYVMAFNGWDRTTKSRITHWMPMLTLPEGDKS